MRILLTSIILIITLCGATDVCGKTTRNKKSGQNASEEAAYDIEAVKYQAKKGDAAALNQLGVWYYTGKNVPRDVNRAFELWREAALQHNAKAISNLGVCYQYGTGVERDSLSAMRLYIAAIDAGQEDLFRQRNANVGTTAFDGMLIGLCYEKGIGTPIDLRQAAKAYSASADLGSKDALVPAAKALSLTGETRRAIDYAIKAADSGQDQAQYLAGTLILDNDINTDRAALAIDYLTKAAENGNIEAANYLGRANLEGKYGLITMGDKIAQWLKTAADKGNTQSMQLLAATYENATGVNRDFDSAIQYYRNALAILDPDSRLETFIGTRSPADKWLDTYISALNLIEKGDFKQAETKAKELSKAKYPEGSLIQALIIADPKNPKQNIKKAKKELQKISSRFPRAAKALETL